MNTLFNLTDALLTRGYSEEGIGKIWGDPHAQLIDDDEDTPSKVPHFHKQ